MARYTNTVETKLSDEQINQLVMQILQAEGFKQKHKNGEELWQKGGMLIAPQFIKVTSRNGSAVVEGWIKFAILPGVYYGEMDLTGAMGAPVKNMLRKRLVKIEDALKG